MKFLSKKEVKALTLYSDAHRARLEEVGTFPKRIKLGEGRYARVGYLESEVEEWMKAAIAKRDSQRSP
jgi:prophage regulatory protein